jgi:hypothetical protein
MKRVNQSFPLLKKTMLLGLAGSMLAAGLYTAAVPFTSRLAFAEEAAAISAKLEQVKAASKEIASEDEQLKVNMSIPVLSGMKDTKYEEQLNGLIESQAMKDLENAKMSAKESAEKAAEAGFPVRQAELLVQYELKADGSAQAGGIVSLRVVTYHYAGGANGITRADHYTVTNAAEAKLVKLSDLLGADYIGKVNKVVTDKIAEHPENYFKDGFKGIQESQPFYVENGEIVVEFPKYSIAPGSSGLPAFRIPIPSSTAAGSAVSVTAKVVASEDEQLKVNLSIPVLSGMKDAKYQEQLNQLIEAQAMKGLEISKQDAKESAEALKASGYPVRPFELLMKYELTADGSEAENGIVSLRVIHYIYTGGAHGITRVDHYTVNNAAVAAPVKLSDLLGSGYIDIVNQAVASEIASNPDNYFKDGFKGIKDSQPFFVENGEVVVEFSVYEIAPYAAGEPKFRIPIPAAGSSASVPEWKEWSLSVLGEAVSPEQGKAFVKAFVKTDGTIMVPLRLIAEKLGFTLTWKAETSSAELSRGAQWTSVTLGKDQYVFNKAIPFELGAVPEIVGETMVVPLSFFDRVLNATVEKSQDGVISINLTQGTN